MNKSHFCEMQPLLHTKALGRSIRFYDKIDSTNTEAKRCAAGGAAHGTVFVAEEQTQGKGRLGRQWVSPPGDGLWFTLLLRPRCTPAQAAGLTLITGLAVCRAIRTLGNIDARIKWPNDIVTGGKKLCGILLEMGTENGSISFVAVGVGINVNTTNFPEEIAYKASSLRLETGRTQSREELLAAVLNEFEPLLEQYLQGNTEPILLEYRSLCVTLGRQISTQRADGTLSGVAEDVTDDGELVVRTPAGTREIIFTGEVSVQGIYEEPKR